MRIKVAESPFFSIEKLVIEGIFVSGKIPVTYSEVVAFYMRAESLAGCWKSVSEP
jgi:hypothetical protein